MYVHTRFCYLSSTMTLIFLFDLRDEWLLLLLLLFCCCCLCCCCCSSCCLLLLLLLILLLLMMIMITMLLLFLMLLLLLFFVAVCVVVVVVVFSQITGKNRGQIYFIAFSLRRSYQFAYDVFNTYYIGTSYNVDNVIWYIQTVYQLRCYCTPVNHITLNIKCII